MEVTTERISSTYDLTDMLLSLQNGFRFVKVVVTFVILERTVGFQPLSPYINVHRI